MTHLSQNETIAVALGILVVGLVFVGSYALPFINSAETADVVTLSNSTSEPAQAAALLQGAISQNGTVNKLIIEDVTEGSGAVVAEGDVVLVNYVGALENGTQFDSSYARNEPFSFTVGAGDVIEGWEKGILGMKAGGKRILIIPASMAYGNRAVDSVPRNSTLIFSVELLKVN